MYLWCIFVVLHLLLTVREYEYVYIYVQYTQTFTFGNFYCVLLVIVPSHEGWISESQLLEDNLGMEWFCFLSIITTIVTNYIVVVVVVVAVVGFMFLSVTIVVVTRCFQIRFENTLPETPSSQCWPPNKMRGSVSAFWRRCEQTKMSILTIVHHVAAMV